MVGVAVSVTIANIHAGIAELGDSYTSFCNVNSSINCDVVLRGPWAKLAGIPIAHFAIVAYLGLAGLFAGAAARPDLRPRLLPLAAAGVTGSVVFSLFMAGIAAVMLQTACLMCMGLYAVALVSAGTTFAALRILARSGRPSPFPPGAAAATAAASAVAVAVLALVTWPEEKTVAAEPTSVEELCSVDPEFCDWYLALPKGPVAGLLRSDQQAAASSGRVVIVDFFDLECGHCRKNFLLLEELKERRGASVEFVHRHFPLDATCNDVVPTSLHANACRAAEAVECAGLQGRHDEMIAILFENQTQLFAENLLRLGGRIGLDTEALRRCLDEHATLPKVLEDARAGARLEITSTPTVFVAGRRIKGSFDDASKYEIAVLLEKLAD